MSSIFETSARYHFVGRLFPILLALIATSLHFLPENFIIGETLRTRLHHRHSDVFCCLLYTVGLVLEEVTHEKLRSRFRRWLPALSIIWIIVTLVSGLLGTNSQIGQSGWLGASLDTSGIIVLLGYSELVSLLLSISLYDFYVAAMPEVANRAIYWSLNTLTILIGILFTVTGVQTLVLPGLIILVFGATGILYAYITYRVFDVRLSLIVGIRTLAFMLVSWIVIFASVYTINRLNINLDVVGTLVIAAFAIILAAILVPIRQLVQFFFDKVLTSSKPNISEAMADYSRNVARATTLDDVVNATTLTLNHVLNVSRSSLILISDTFRVADSVELAALFQSKNPALPPERKTGLIAKTSPIFRTLAMEKVPLSQFDIDYNPIYKDIAEGEKEFFKMLNMSIYVPIVTENRLIGLLTCSKRNNDLPFYHHDLELLTLIGQQVGTALRSARLIDDLRHLNTSMQSLNTRLETATEDLEKLDSIKTDFVTIASHELRTPLAQNTRLHRYYRRAKRSGDIG